VTKRLTLKARAGDLPLGWEAGERLQGQKREGPYLVGSATPTGKALTERLRALGPGRKVITIEGYYQPADQESLEHLPMFTRRSEVGLHLDAQALGFQVHEMVRRFRESEKARVGGTDTPKEAYVTAIHIRTIAGPEPTQRVVKERKRVKLKSGKKVWREVSVVRSTRVHYLDTRTGKLVSRDTWERSRRQIRARTPKGKAAKQGRYVRRLV